MQTWGDAAIVARIDRRLASLEQLLPAADPARRALLEALLTHARVARQRTPVRDVASGRFRQNLYYRLNGMALRVPPLRERQADIEALAKRFLADTWQALRPLQRVSQPRLSADALRDLLRYAWPGNIRELRNVVERAALLCDAVEVLRAHLPNNLTAPSDAAGPAFESDREQDPKSRLVEQLEQLERQRIIDTLALHGGNQTQAAEQLGISRRTLVTRLGQYELPRPRKAR